MPMGLLLHLLLLLLHVLVGVVVVGAQQALEFHPPVGAIGGLGWGDSLHSLTTAEVWNESVVFFAGEPPQAGFATVSMDGGNTWQQGGNWSRDFCVNDSFTFGATKFFVETANGVVHTFGTARGSGITVGAYSSFNSTSATIVQHQGPLPANAAHARCVQKTVTFRGLPVPVYCNEIGVKADCFGYFGSSLRLGDGSWLQVSTAHACTCA